MFLVKALFTMTHIIPKVSHWILRISRSLLKFHRAAVRLGVRAKGEEGMGLRTWAVASPGTALLVSVF